MLTPKQRARHDNLHALVRKLEELGLTTRAAQARALGPSIRGERLEAMLGGGEISQFTALAIEHYLRRPRHWMDHPHEDVGDIDTILGASSTSETRGGGWSDII